MEGMAYVSENFWHDAVNKATTDLFTFGYKNIIKPNFVFNHTPDVAHDQMIEFCNVTKRIPPLMWLLREMLDYTDPVLETTVMGVDFANPFGLSAGLDKNCDMPVLMDNVGFGFETVGSTTSRASAGNPKPWFHRLPEYDSMMVHVGLANDGSDKVIDRAEQAWTNAKTMQVSVSIARTNDDKCGDLDEGIEDYCISMRRAAGRSAMEIPQQWEGGLSGGPCTVASEERIAQVYREYGERFAIAGIGGVFTPQQAYRKIRNGASLVMFISALMYRGPQQITVLKRGLAALLKRDGFEHISDAVGIDA